MNMTNGAREGGSVKNGVPFKNSRRGFHIAVRTSGSGSKNADLRTAALRSSTSSFSIAPANTLVELAMLWKNMNDGKSTPTFIGEKCC